MSSSIDLKPDQKAALDMLRTYYMRPEYPFDCCGMPVDDNTLLRYLRARKFNVDHAKELLDRTIEWREKTGLHQLYDGSHAWREILTTENTTGKMYVRGFDKEGHAILYMIPRHENTRQHEGNVKHLIFNVEKAIQCMKRTGKEKILLLIDYKGFSLSNSPPMKTSMEILGILQDYYPERLKKAYMINPPWVFSAFWNVISPFVDPVTKEKIQFLKDDSITAALDKVLDLEVLEASLKGKDDRAFNSLDYIHSPIEIDFYTLLEQKSKTDSDTKLTEAEVGESSEFSK